MPSRKRRVVTAIGVAAVTACAVFPSALIRASVDQSAGLRIVVIEGEDAVNIIQQKTAVAPIVEVRDRNDQPVAGAIVRFAVQGGRATFGGAQTLTVTTNAVGQAVATGLTPTASGALQISASAAFQGQTAAAVTITQTNVMTAAQAASLSGAAGGNAGAGASGGAAAGGHSMGLIVGGLAAAGAGVGAIVAATGDSSEPAATASATEATFSGRTEVTPGITFRLFRSTPPINVATTGNYRFRVSFSSPADCALLLGVCPTVGNCHDGLRGGSDPGVCRGGRMDVHTRSGRL